MFNESFFVWSQPMVVANLKIIFMQDLIVETARKILLYYRLLVHRTLCIAPGFESMFSLFTGISERIQSCYKKGGHFLIALPVCLACKTNLVTGRIFLVDGINLWLRDKVKSLNLELAAARLGTQH